MFKFSIIFFVFFNSLNLEAQQAYEFPTGVDKIEIPFQSAYNLMIVPLHINGVEVRMIVDTGTSNSIIFNFSNIDSLSFNRGKLLKVKGYGKENFYTVHYSKNNRIELNGYVNNNSTIYVAAGEEINMEPHLGITVNGLLGKDFFNNARVKIDYVKEVIVLYKHTKNLRKKLKRMERLPFSLKDGKPYINGIVNNGIEDFEVELLIDTGNGDALWMIEREDKFILNNISFEDFLGVGLNGETYGDRSKFKNLRIGNFQFANVTASIPYNNKRSKRILY